MGGSAPLEPPPPHERRNVALQLSFHPRHRLNALVTRVKLRRVWVGVGHGVADERVTPLIKRAHLVPGERHAPVGVFVGSHVDVVLFSKGDLFLNRRVDKTGDKAEDTRQSQRFQQRGSHVEVVA